MSYGHSEGVHCLRDSHISQKCSFCLAPELGRNWEIKLRLLGMECFLQPSSEPDQETPPTSPIHLSSDSFSTLSTSGYASPTKGKHLEHYGKSPKMRNTESISKEPAPKKTWSPLRSSVPEGIIEAKNSFSSTRGPVKPQRCKQRKHGSDRVFLPSIGKEGKHRVPSSWALPSALKHSTQPWML